MKTTEQDVQKSIIDFLKIKRFIVFKHRNVGIYKQDTGRYIPLAFGEKGVSDIIACAPGGKFWAIEVKGKYRKPTPDQVDFLARVNAAGGKGILTYSLDEVMDAVAEESSFPPAQHPQPPVSSPEISVSKTSEGSPTRNKV